MEERMREVAVAEEKRRTMEWMGGTEGEEVGEEPISKDHPPQMVANIRVNRSARNLESRDIRRLSGGIHPTSRTQQRQTLVRGYEAVH
jgi:hypothetical protein